MDQLSLITNRTSTVIENRLKSIDRYAGKIWRDQCLDRGVKYATLQCLKHIRTLVNEETIKINSFSYRFPEKFYFGLTSYRLRMYSTFINFSTEGNAESLIVTSIDVSLIRSNRDIIYQITK